MYSSRSSLRSCRRANARETANEPGAEGHMGVFPWMMNSRSCANYKVKVSKCFDAASKTKEASIDDTRRTSTRATRRAQERKPFDVFVRDV